VLIGPSGSGKSFLAKQILLNDAKRRRIFLFSKVRHDPSLSELLMPPLNPRLEQVPLFTKQDLINLPPDSDMSGGICFFDDIDSFGGEKGSFLREKRDHLLEDGRHKGITIFSTSHILSNFNKTRTILNEAEWVVLFPNANRRSADLFLKDRMGMSKKERDALIRKSGSGRFLAVKLSCPNAVLHQHGVLLL
jgi:hypothetical protein